MALVVTGLTELKAALEAMASRVEVATPLAVEQAVELVKEKAQTNLSRYSHTRGTPTPSPSGEPPAKITGNLHDSWDILGPTPAGVAAWMATLGPTAPYARIQELGGVAGHGAVLPGRPYLQPAYQELIDDGELLDVYVRTWRVAVTG
jgi:phage gpG-like protein